MGLKKEFCIGKKSHKYMTCTYCDEIKNVLVLLKEKSECWHLFKILCETNSNTCKEQLWFSDVVEVLK